MKQKRFETVAGVEVPKCEKEFYINDGDKRVSFICGKCFSCRRADKLIQEAVEKRASEAGH